MLTTLRYAVDAERIIEKQLQPCTVPLAESSFAPSFAHTVITPGAGGTARLVYHHRVSTRLTDSLLLLFLLLLLLVLAVALQLSPLLCALALALLPGIVLLAIPPFLGLVCALLSIERVLVAVDLLTLLGLALGCRRQRRLLRRGSVPDR